MMSSDRRTKPRVNGRKMSVQTVLKKVWNIAICVAADGNQRAKVICMNDGHISNIVMKITEPNVLKSR